MTLARFLRLLGYLIAFLLSLGSASILFRVKTRFAEVFGWLFLSIALNSGVFGLMLLVGAKMGGIYEIAAVINALAQGVVSAFIFSLLTAYQKENGYHGTNQS